MNDAPDYGTPFEPLEKRIKLSKTEALNMYLNEEITELERHTRIITTTTTPSPYGHEETNPDFIDTGDPETRGVYWYITLPDLLKTAVINEWQELSSTIMDELNRIWEDYNHKIGSDMSRKNVVDKLVAFAFYYADQRAAANFEANFGFSWHDAKQISREFYSMVTSDKPQDFQDWWNWASNWIPAPRRDLSTLDQHHMTFSDKKYADLYSSITNVNQITLGGEMDRWNMGQNAKVTIPVDGWVFNLTQRHTFIFGFQWGPSNSSGIFSWRINPKTSSHSAANANENYSNYSAPSDIMGAILKIGHLFDVDKILYHHWSNYGNTSDALDRRQSFGEFVLSADEDHEYRWDIYPAGDPYISGMTADTIMVEHKMDNTILFQEVVNNASSYGDFQIDELIAYQGIKTLIYMDMY